MATERPAMKMIILFKMIAEGEHTPVNNFYAKVEAAAEEEGVVLREFKNEFMMPTTNMLREDQSEMVMERIEERWVAKDDRLERIRVKGSGLLIYAVVDGSVEWVHESLHETDIYAFKRRALDDIMNGVPDYSVQEWSVTNMSLLEKHLNECYRTTSPDMVAVRSLYSALRCVQEILKAQVDD